MIKFNISLRAIWDNRYTFVLGPWFVGSTGGYWLLRQCGVSIVPYDLFVLAQLGVGLFFATIMLLLHRTER